MHDSTHCDVCRGLARDGSLTDAEFAELLASCRDELARKQSSLRHRIDGQTRWSYDMAQSSITFGEIRFAMTPIGMFSAEHGTWLWAWANEDFPARARDEAREIQGLHASTGFRVFLDEGTVATVDDAYDLTALAVHQLGAIGYFCAPGDGPVLYLAIHDKNVSTARS